MVTSSILSVCVRQRGAREDKEFRQRNLSTNGVETFFYVLCTEAMKLTHHQSGLREINIYEEPQEPSVTRIDNTTTDDDEATSVHFDDERNQKEGDGTENVIKIYPCGISFSCICEGNSDIEIPRH